MVKSIKNVFSSFVATMMVVSSVGAGSLGFANVASAATAGDLLKASGPAVYYYAVDGKRYVFPNEKTYFSWYADFSSVKTISDSELAAIQIGGNVTIRPGTKLVKIQTDPKVYAVTRCGVLHWVESETLAKSLYGDAWATRVVDVPDAFFVNYNVGSSVSTAVHPDGQTVSYAGDSNKYIVMSGKKRKFASDAAWTANGLNSANTIATTITYVDGTEVTAREAELADTVCATAQTPVSGDLTVALASDTPAGVTIPKNSSSVPLAKFVFTGGAAEAKITGMTVHRTGVGAAGDWSNIYLYNGDGKRLTTGRTINSTSHNATFSSLSITVPAGGTQVLMIYGDASNPSSTGGQHAIEIVDAASIVVSGSTVMKGSFPVRGNVFTIGTSSAGRLDVQKGTTPSNPTVGAKEAEVSNFKLIANTNDIKVNQITLYQAGSITNSDLTNFKLYQASTLVASTDKVGTDGRIVLKFTTPYLIGNGTTKVFSLKADVGGRSSRTIITYVEYTTDVNATDVVYNAGPAVCIADTATGGCAAASQGSFDGDANEAGTADDNQISVTTQGGTLSVAFNGPPTSNIAKGSQAVALYKFSLTAETSLEIRNIRFQIDESSVGTTCYVKGSAGTTYFRSIKIKNMDTGATVMGPTEMASGLANSSTGTGAITLADSFNMTAGQMLNLAIVSDLSNAEDATGELFGNSNCGFKATLNAFQSSDVRIVDSGEFLATTSIVPNSATAGNQQNVKSSSLTVALAGSPSSGTLVKKSANVPVAGIVLTSGAQSNILVTSIKLTCQAALATTGNAFGSAAALANCDTRVNSFSLWNGDVQVGISKAPDTTTGDANITNTNLTVPAGSSVNLTVKATLGSTASTTSPYDQISVGIAADADVVAQDKDANSVTPSRSTTLDANADGASPSVVQTIRNSGTVSYTASSHPSSAIIVAGNQDVWVPFASYQASAQFEAVELDRVAVFASSSNGGVTSDNAIYTTVAVAVGGAVKGQDILSGGTTGTKDIDLSNNKVVVPKNGSVTFQLWAKLSDVQSSSSVSGATTGVHRSGMSPALGLDSNLQTGEWDSSYFSSANIRATGQASGERVYASTTNAGHGNPMITRKSKPIVTKQSLSSTTLANTDMDLIKFQVAADSKGPVSLKQIMFSISKTSGLTLSNFRVRKGATDKSTADFAINYSSTTGGLTDVESGSLATTQNSGYIILSFTNEEGAEGSGNVYTLHATVSGAVSGQNISLSFLRDTSSRRLTGYLRSNVAFGGVVSSTAVYLIDPSAAATSSEDSPQFVATHATGTFLWSDRSESNHNSSVGTSGGTRDWTNDVYVEDVSQTQTVSL